MPTADLDGVSLYYEDSGGDGTPVLFSHGLLMSSAMFAPQVAALAPRHRCVAYDHRGQGSPTKLRACGRRRSSSAAGCVWALWSEMQDRVVGRQTNGQYCDGRYAICALKCAPSRAKSSC